MIEVISATGEPTGDVVWKSEAHRKGLWHRSFHCWILSPEGPDLLVQRRAQAKELWPDKLDVTAAGHLLAGERDLDGLRELEEELGLCVDPSRLIPLETRRVDQEIPAGRNREFQSVYLLLDSTHPAEMRLQTEEVASVVRLRLHEVERMHYGKAITGEEWIDGEARVINVSLSDFVSDEDSYLMRVARAAQRVLRETRL